MRGGRGSGGPLPLSQVRFQKLAFLPLARKSSLVTILSSQIIFMESVEARQNYICPHCEMTTGTFGLWSLPPVGTACGAEG